MKMQNRRFLQLNLWLRPLISPTLLILFVLLNFGLFQRELAQLEQPDPLQDGLHVPAELGQLRGDQPLLALRPEGALEEVDVPGRRAGIHVVAVVDEELLAGGHVAVGVEAADDAEARALEEAAVLAVREEGVVQFVAKSRP